MAKRVFKVVGGKVTTRYHDADPFVKGLAGRQKITRASDVEPDENGDWVADMSKLGSEHRGVKLGPFKERAAALQAEIAYIDNFLASKQGRSQD